jgi:hypothetical protein
MWATGFFACVTAIVFVEYRRGRHASSNPATGQNEHADWPPRDDFAHMIGAKLELQEYPDDHGHCRIDWAEFTNDPDSSHWHEGRETFLNAYRVLWRGPHGEMEDWICPSCGVRYRERFSWTLVPDPDAGSE